MKNQENHMTIRTAARRHRLALVAAGVGVLVAAGIAAPPAFATGGGHGHTPVTICHNGKTITVDDSAVKAHLHHGDTLGACPTPEPTPPVVTPEPTEPPATEEPTPEPTTPPVTPDPTPTTPTPELTEPPVTETPTPEPTTPPTETPAPVVGPQIQDYITCKGGAFVLDNTGSTVPVTYTINDLPFTVPAGQAIHTDSDGTLLQPNSDYAGFTIKAGERTWNFPSAGNCPTVPVTPEPTAPPTDEPTVPPTTEPSPPVTEEPTPVPSDQPTEPSDSTPAASTPPIGPGSPSAPATTSTPEPAVKHSNSGTPTQQDTVGTLAFTGSPLTVGAQIVLIAVAILAVGFGALLLTLRTMRRRKELDRG